MTGVQTCALPICPLPRIDGDVPADRLIGALRAARAPLAIVTDADGRVAGLLTINDVLGELLGRGGPTR